MTADELRQRANLSRQSSFVSDIDNFFTAKDTSNLPVWRRIVENRFFRMFIIFCIAVSRYVCALLFSDPRTRT
jgi:hypothetical protein